MLPAEGKQLARQVSRALRRAKNGFDAFSRARIHTLRFLQDNFGVALDHHQQVVKVVRDATRKPPNGLHLLRLPDLIFEHAASGLVSRRYDDAAYRHVIEQIISNRLQPDPRAILVTETKLGRSRTPDFERHPLERSAHGRFMLGMNQRQEAPAEKLRRLISCDSL